MLDVKEASISLEAYTPPISPIFEEHPKKEKFFYTFLKRTFDILASLLGLLILSPIFAAISLLIKLDDGGPIIHTRTCVGSNFRLYKMYKFRTMRVDADNLEKWLSPEQIEQYNKECKLDNDPRITRIGRFLRKTSLDELPQLVSVFKGDMSIVGPRPLVDSELVHYGTDLEKVLFTKAGITGYWQVNGRSNSTYESGERQKLELFYVTHCSVWLDTKILIKTFAVVLNMDGAK